MKFTKLWVFDWGSDAMNDILADEIETAGAIIDYLMIDTSL
jgi:hypothetical protein